MSISCALGLAACLNYGDTMLTERDAFDMVTECRFVEDLEPYRFEGLSGMGIVVAESLEERGLNFVWVRGGANRKREILRACRIYITIYQNDANWDNPDKRI